MTSRKQATAATVVESTPAAATVADSTPSPESAPGEGVTLTPPNGSEQHTSPSGNGAGEAQPVDPLQPLLQDLTRPTGQRGRGRPPGSKNRRTAENPEPPGERKVLGEFKPKVDYDGMALLTVHTVVGVSVQLMGPEWNTSPEEDTNLCNATAAYFRAKQFPDIPPGWMLMFVVAAYVVPRLNHPNTKAKLARGRDKALNLFRRKQ